MTIKIIITRNVPKEKARDIIPLFRQMRALAIQQPGYISGETLKSTDRPDTFIVISSWETADDWERWLLSKERQEIQGKFDALLGGNTEYEMFRYGIAE